MWTISEIKEKGKVSFKNNYWYCVFVAFILTLITGGTSASGTTGSFRKIGELFNEQDPEVKAIILGIFAIVMSIIVICVIIWSLVNIFLLNPLYVGCACFFKENSNSAAPITLIKNGFTENYARNVLTMFITDLFNLLWFCLFIIPGIIKSYSYRMVPYILFDEPDLPATEVITRSRKMMDGHKWKAFLLDLSFIGWEFLSLITCGLVGIFWTSPYRKSSNAALYNVLKESMKTDA
ncbi:DUF975 family protein [Lachnospiraceae bacterium C1.1]|nr:DUF975 family protein [Lachnospiraceae bacterium C1.1]